MASKGGGLREEAGESLHKTKGRNRVRRLTSEGRKRGVRKKEVFCKHVGGGGKG